MKFHFHFHPFPLEISGNGNALFNKNSGLRFPPTIHFQFGGNAYLFVFIVLFVPFPISTYPLLLRVDRGRSGDSSPYLFKRFFYPTMETPMPYKTGSTQTPTKRTVAQFLAEHATVLTTSHPLEEQHG
ncbi:MAG: hypothetical protein HQL72_02565 [Magnetococcales bacterium]|nr:hypothetical protein [Magnetococcales bacterium]